MPSTSQSFPRTSVFATPVSVHVLTVALLLFLPSCTGDEAPSPSESAPVASSGQSGPLEQVQGVPESDTTDHTGDIQGVVRNAEGEPLAPANLFFPELEIGAATRGDGHYVIRGVPPGTHTLAVSYGELQTEVEVEIIADSLVQRDITLE